jgi:hypothetical protein
MVRMTDKVNRLQSLVKNGSLANEAAEDSLLDIAVYAVIALVLREKAVRARAREAALNAQTRGEAAEA